MQSIWNQSFSTIEQFCFITFVLAGTSINIIYISGFSLLWRRKTALSSAAGRPGKVPVKLSNTEHDDDGGNDDDDGGNDDDDGGDYDNDNDDDITTTSTTSTSTTRSGT